MSHWVQEQSIEDQVSRRLKALRISSTPSTLACLNYHPGYGPSQVPNQFTPCIDGRANKVFGSERIWRKEKRLRGGYRNAILSWKKSNSRSENSPTFPRFPVMAILPTNYHSLNLLIDHRYHNFIRTPALTSSMPPICPPDPIPPPLALVFPNGCFDPPPRSPLPASHPRRRFSFPVRPPSVTEPPPPLALTATPTPQTWEARGAARGRRRIAKAAQCRHGRRTCIAAA